MRLRFLLPLAAAALLLPLMHGQKKWAVPRTSDGHPDLEGYWTNATITPLERPAELATAINEFL